MTADDIALSASDIFFRVCEVFFKFITWLFILVALRAAWEATGVRSLYWLLSAANVIYGAALITQIMAIAARDPTTYGVPNSWRGPAFLGQIVLSAMLASFLIGPYLGIDSITEALMKVRK